MTRSGRAFRPGDWPCRLAGPYGTVVDKVVRHHPGVQPDTLDPAGFAQCHDLMVVRPG